MADQKLRALARRYAQDSTLENATALDVEARRQGTMSSPRRLILSRLLHSFA